MKIYGIEKKRQSVKVKKVSSLQFRIMVIIRNTTLIRNGGN